MFQDVVEGGRIFRRGRKRDGHGHGLSILKEDEFAIVYCTFRLYSQIVAAVGVFVAEALDQIERG
jgi:hypothetical protein